VSWAQMDAQEASGDKQRAMEQLQHAEERKGSSESSKLSETSGLDGTVSDAAPSASGVTERSLSVGGAPGVLELPGIVDLS
jgi:hypothetical protein